MLHLRVDNPDTPFVRSRSLETVVQQPPDSIIADPGKILRRDRGSHFLQVILEHGPERQELLVGQKVRTSRQISFRLSAAILLHPLATEPNRGVSAGSHRVGRVLHVSPNPGQIGRLFVSPGPTVVHFGVLSSHAIDFSGSQGKLDLFYPCSAVPRIERRSLPNL
jgi:hypothetical protein